MNTTTILIVMYSNRIARGRCVNVFDNEIGSRSKFVACDHETEVCIFINFSREKTNF
jgi:hypothetical protein